MSRIYLVRHAKPAAGWGEDPDPGLDSQGHLQARTTADELAKTVGRAPIYSSPLRRCRETALALERTWSCEAEVCPAVAEIPSPPLSLADRRTWLSAAMRGTWQELQRSAPAGSTDYLDWRRTVLATLAALPDDCVIFTHFIAINVAVGAAQNRDAVVCFRPDHASTTVIETAGAELQIVRLGREADTTVLTR